MTDSDLLSIAKQAEGPVYVYDSSKIQSQYLRLKNAFSAVAKLKINYACKALSNMLSYF